MRKVAFGGFRLKLLGSVMAAAMLSACSSDVSRFDDPFGNPFRGSSRFDSTPTGSVRQPTGRDMRRQQQNYAPVTTGSATTEALGAANQAMPAASRPIMPSTGAVQGLNPAAKASGFGAGGVAAANYPSLAPVAQRSGSALANPGLSGAATTVAQAQAVAPIMPAKPVERLQEARQEVRKEIVPVAAPAKPVVARPVGPVRQVGATGESEAEKRAAAKLRELNGKKPAAKDEDDEDEAPAKKASSAPKPVSAAKPEPAKVDLAKVEKARAEKGEAEKARIEAEKQARAEAAKAKADAEKTRLAKLEKTKAEKAAKAKKADDEVTTTASIPAARVPERESAAPKLAKAAEPKAEAKAEAAAETASAETFRWPAKGRVISGFGSRGSGAQNDGINIALPEGTPVRAAEGGVVVHADDALKGYGKMVLVRHPNGYISVYANNGDLNVKRGETVKRGQVIAHSGASGNVTSPQLHFELRKGSTPVDPTTRLAD